MRNKWTLQLHSLQLICFDWLALNEKSLIDLNHIFANFLEVSIFDSITIQRCLTLNAHKTENETFPINENQTKVQQLNLSRHNRTFLLLFNGNEIRQILAWMYDCKRYEIFHKSYWLLMFYSPLKNVCR